MRWYESESGKLRLKLESQQMRDTGFLLYHDDETGLLFWIGFIGKRAALLVYADNHPFDKIMVFLEPKLPKVNFHIHEDGSICYIKDEEWNPDWTAFTVYLTVVRFLDDFYSGRM